MIPLVAAILYAILYSFGVVGIANNGFTLEFWAAIWDGGDFIYSFLFSTIISVVVMFASVFGALLLVVHYRSSLVSSTMKFIIYLPLCLPGIVTAFFTYHILSKSGLFSRIGYNLGFIHSISEFPDLINDQLAIGILLTLISVVLPFFVLIYLNIYDKERINELTDLASSLGASRAQQLWQVEVPILIQKSLRLIIVYFIFLVGSYEVPLILGSSSPQMISVRILQDLRHFDLTKIGEGYAMAVAYSASVSFVAVGLVYLYRRRFV